MKKYIFEPNIILLDTIIYFKAIIENNFTFLNYSYDTFVSFNFKGYKMS